DFAMTRPRTTSDPATDTVELTIGGMTCASCAARIERKLNRMDGVVAEVNYATEKATVSYSGPVAPGDLIATVEATGYSAELPHPESPTDDPHSAEVGSYRNRLIVAATLGIPVILLGMVPAWQFTGWQWVSLALATPVVSRS